MKSKRVKVERQVRIGGNTKIPVGGRDGGVGKHEMSEGVHHVGHVPADVGKSDQNHGK